MNILLVDDQLEVLQGVLVSIHWGQLDISGRFIATNIYEAKEIIQKNQIDLLLCDIEMPLGSGLELYQWVIDKNYKIKCIFLTAHADFCYMQSAIQMKGFDYLLQPAPYEEIENSIRKAIDQIKIESVIDYYYKYGFALKKQENTATEGVLRNYLLKCGEKRSLSDYFTAISLPITDTVLCECILIQVIRWEDDKPWQPHLFQYAISNVVQELFPFQDMHVYAVALNSEMYCLLAFPASLKSALALRQSAEEFAELCPSHLGCSIACYQGDTVSFGELPDMVELLLSLSNRNVARESRFFFIEDLQRKEPHYVPPDFGRWDSLEKEELYSTLRQEALMYLNKHTAEGNITADFLRLLHQDVIYWFINTLSHHGIHAHEAFNQNTEYNYEAMLKSYTDIEQMQALLIFMCTYLESKGRSISPKSHIESVEEYIRKNIQKNISRKELADAVYLNPEYLSRLFKKERGCTISEYITKEKMFLARSLLETTNFSISMIASKVGYSNFSHFTQCFKKEFGIAPSEVRKK